MKTKILQKLTSSSKLKSRLIMLALVFMLGFFGFGLVHNVNRTNKTYAADETVDCNFYIFIHDKDNNPAAGVVINAYDNYDRTNLVATSSPSASNGWAHITTCNVGYDTNGVIYFKPDISTLPADQKLYGEADSDTLRSMVNLSLLDDWGYGEDEIMIFGGQEVTTDNRAQLHVSYNNGTLINNSSLDPNGVVGEDPSFFSSIAGPGYYISAIGLLPGEPEEPDPEQPEPTIETGNLQITKTTSDNNTSTSFNVKITLSGTSTDGTSANTVSGTYGDATFDDGIATITIKHGQTKNITDLPAGISYTVEETNPGDYTVTYTNQTGAITKDQTKTVTINNQKPGYIRIEKYTNHSVADDRTGILSPKYSVTLKLSGTSVDGQSADSINGAEYIIYNYDESYDHGFEFINGVAELSLKHGDIVEFYLPLGLEYEITEEKGGYEQFFDHRGVTEYVSREKATGVVGRFTLLIIHNYYRYNLSFKKVDAETGEELHGWEFRMGDAKITEDDNTLTFYTAGINTGWEHPTPDLIAVKNKSDDDIKNILEPITEPFYSRCYDDRRNPKCWGNLEGVEVFETRAPSGYHKQEESFQLYGGLLRYISTALLEPINSVGSTWYNITEAMKLRIDSPENIERNSGDWYTFNKIDDWNAEIIIKNKKLPEPETPEEPKEEKETPVEVINPKTEDKKLTTLIIMMGSAVVLFGAIITKRRHHI